MMKEQLEFIMNNHPLINPETGKEEWISRAIAVVVFLFAEDSYGDTYILVVNRGKGTPDPEFVGKYCVPCGYLDYNETITQAAQRELVEETGINAPISDFKFVSINDNPKGDKRQNVTFRFRIDSNIYKENLEQLLTINNSEKDEVASVRFINIKDIDMYEWAFNHQELIKKISSQKTQTTFDR